VAQTPEKAHAHRGWPPMVINNAEYKIISGSPRAMCKHKKKHKTVNTEYNE